MKRYIALCPRGVTIVGPVVFQSLLWVKPALCLLYLYRERAEFGNGSVNCRFKGLHGNGTHAIVVTGYWILFMLTLLHVRLSWFLNVIVLVNIIEIKNLQIFTEKWCLIHLWVVTCNFLISYLIFLLWVLSDIKIWKHLFYISLLKVVFSLSENLCFCQNTSTYFEN